MNSRFISLLLSGLICFFLIAAPAAEATTGAVAQAEFDLHTTTYAHPKTPGAAVLAATLTPAPGWYAYAPDPGNPFVRPPKLVLMADGQPLPNLLPAGHPKPDPLKPGEMVEVYDTATTFFLVLPKQTAGLSIPGQFTAVLCDGTQCILPRKKLTVALPAEYDALPPLPAELASQFGALTEQAVSIKEPTTAPTPETSQEMEPGAEATLPVEAPWAFTPRSFSPALEVTGLTSAILLGLLAGLILNVMPCVLPVVSLKLSALMSGAGEGDERERQRRFREHNFFFGLGALLYFVFLAALLSIGGFAWGELFQSPWVIGALAAILFLLSLSLFGLFHLPVIDLKFDQSVDHPKLKAMSTGMLATLLATPCSGPLLGGVLGWALLRPGSEVAIVFLAIGLGMASPYFLMILFPSLVRFFPKPGPWLAHVEKAVAIFLLAAVIYLMSILPDIGIVPWLAAAWCVGTAIWVWRITGSGTKSLLFRIAALALALFGPYLFLMPSDSKDPWTNFNQEQFRQDLGKTFMVLDFTADWCPTCKVLEATVLTDDAVRKWEQQTGATFIRVDLTHNSPRSEALLKELGSHSIPLVALFPAGENATSPIVIRDLFTSGQLTQALKQAKRESQ